MRLGIHQFNSIALDVINEIVQDQFFNVRMRFKVKKPRYTRNVMYASNLKCFLTSGYLSDFYTTQYCIHVHAYIYIYNNSYWRIKYNCIKT